MGAIWISKDAREQLETPARAAVPARRDLLTVATAFEHELSVATRNVRPIEPTGAKLLNPYEA